MDAQEITRILNQIIELDPQACSALDAVFLWELTAGEDASRLVLDFRAKPRLYVLAKDAPVPLGAVHISLSKEDAASIISGNLTAQQAFLEGRLKAAGDLQAVLRFNIVFELLQKAVVAVRPNGASLT